MTCCARSRWARSVAGSLCGFVSLLFVALEDRPARAGLTFLFTEASGMTTLRGTDSAKADSIMAGMASAAARWSSIISTDVTLNYAVDYTPSSFPLGAALDVYEPTLYMSGGGGVKPAMISKATSPADFAAISKLQPGPVLSIWINDFSAGPDFPPTLDADGSPNNSLIDISRAHKKALGLLPAHATPTDGTIKFGPSAFDFDPSNGIDAGKFDFVGVALHELAHSMGFVSGVETVSLYAPPGSPPPSPPGMTPMVTVLDLFRYSSDSFAAGPPGSFIPDMSLPTPSSSDTRYFSLDGGASPMELFSTGTKLAGDGKQAGHWKDDGTFGLMDPELDAGFALTAAFDAMVSSSGAFAPDLVALDVIGWTITIVPEASPIRFGLLLCGAMGLIYLGRRPARQVSGTA